MILESPLKIRDEIQQLNRATMPIKNVNADSVTTLEIKFVHLKTSLSKYFAITPYKCLMDTHK
jgi:hypothetical protein